MSFVAFVAPYNAQGDRGGLFTCMHIGDRGGLFTCMHQCKGICTCIHITYLLEVCKGIFACIHINFICTYMHTDTYIQHIHTCTISHEYTYMYDRNLCQDLCFLQWDIKIEKNKILHCKKASSNTDMSLLQCVNNTINYGSLKG